MRERAVHVAGAIAIVAVACGLSVGQASAAGCPWPGVRAPIAEQENAMACMVNGYRKSHRVRALERSATLDRAAGLKIRAIVSCGSFSHTPCGRSFTSTFDEAGYVARNTGENLAWGAGSRASARRAFLQLLASPTHRANILGSGWRELGVALRRGPLFGFRDAGLWVITFGRR